LRELEETTGINEKEDDENAKIVDEEIEDIDT
jgi:hypothetical protein